MGQYNATTVINGFCSMAVQTLTMFAILRETFRRSPQFSRLPNTEHDTDHHPGRGGTRRLSLIPTLICFTIACLLCWMIGIWTAHIWITDHYCVRRSSMGCKLTVLYVLGENTPPN